jgi:hypothetical protein
MAHPKGLLQTGNQPADRATGHIMMSGMSRMAMHGWVAGLAVVLLACSAPEPMGDLLHIQDDQFRIGNPSREHAWATGIACGGTENDAVVNAQDVAQFNLRNLTGAARYRVQYRVLRRIPTQGRACVEVEALAISVRSR